MKSNTSEVAILSLIISSVLFAWYPAGQEIHAEVPGGKASRLEVGQARQRTVLGQWNPSGPMRTPRIHHSATLLPSGEVLVVGGTNDEQTEVFSAAESFDPATNSWRLVAGLAISRRDHTATLLRSGEVLVVGGSSQDGVLQSAEIYHVKTGIWRSAEQPLVPRSNHTATLLRSGRVLVVGGAGLGGSLQEVEIFDPDTGTWQQTSPLNTGRTRHTTTLLPSGEVLVVGGIGASGASAVVEIFDPTTSSWRQAASLRKARAGHVATLLPSGQVLVSGGADRGNILRDSELYDPRSNSWSRSRFAPIHARAHHSATLLPTDEVLVVGGAEESNESPGDPTEAEIYSPVGEFWALAGVSEEPRSWHTATLLPAGDVLIVGGLPHAEVFAPARETWLELPSEDPPLAALGKKQEHTATLLDSGDVLVAGGLTFSHQAWVYRSSTGEWEQAGRLLKGRSFHTSTRLHSGEVLITGGFADGFLGTTEKYVPASDQWTAAPSLRDARVGHTATLLPSGKVLIVGGERDHNSLSSTERFDPATNAWGNLGELQSSRSLHTATLLSSGKILVTGGAVVTTPDGGQTNVQVLSTAELFDPVSGTWEFTGSLATPRLDHTATILHSGKVLVAGGWSDDEGDIETVEIYNPATGRWSAVEALESGRFNHTATLLPSGQVLVVGGAVDALQTAEIYDPATGLWSLVTPPQAEHDRHTATLLPSGQVLVTGGKGIELFRINPLREIRRPVITQGPGSLRFGVPLAIRGHGFRGDLEASDGTSRNSSVNYPLVQVRNLTTDQISWLIPDHFPVQGDEPATLEVSDLPPTLDPGPHLLTVVTAGISSEPWTTEVECSLAILKHPEDQLVAQHSSATFVVETQGGRFFQWQKDGIDIPGATGPSYTTPPVLAADSGTSYRVRVGSGCTSDSSREARLVVDDHTPPNVQIEAPRGGEFWLLSANAEEPDQQLVSWTMSDDIRICQVEGALIYSNDGGETWATAVAASWGPGGACAHPGFGMSSVRYSVPTEPPSGATGSLYRIRITATDHAGNQTIAENDNSFFIVRPNNESIKTLILGNFRRMKDFAAGAGGEQGVEQLKIKLQELADHPRIEGRVIDLGEITDLQELYEIWDENHRGPTPDPELANIVLFGCHPGEDGLFASGCVAEKRGIHDLILESREAFSGVEYVLLIGDDRILPMARVRDRTVLFPESNYTSDDPSDLNAGLTTRGTTVGVALHANQYLTDDPLAVLDEIQPRDLQEDGNLFLPDLAVGRLVETPEEITKAIATFISQDGILDLSVLDPDMGHKVLVSGYDFLIDSGKKVRRRWKDAFAVPPPYDDDAIAPVDGQLLERTWGEETVTGRQQALLSHLSGHGGPRYGIVNPSGHATHYELGVPGQTRLSIHGLSAAELSKLDLAGSLVYAVGCHGGLVVAGSDEEADHPFDLPQAMMKSGVQAYLANTGYGWGLLHGIGLSERMIEVFTEEMSRGGTVVVGDAVRRTKNRYFLESSTIDAYDLKTLMQWTLFGFPMYSVKTGILADDSVATVPFVGEPPQMYPLPAAEQHTVPFLVERRMTTGDPRVEPSDPDLPRFLARVVHRFDLTGADLYTKHDASGRRLAADTVGCLDPNGCYYTLNGLATDAVDVPVQPLFIFDSRLSGTSQHGVLWMGGTWEEETDWIPLFAELASNGGDGSNHGTTPIGVVQAPRGGRRRGRGHLGGEGDACRPSDLELNSVVVTTGEVAKASPGDEDFSILRLHRTVDLEVFYLNDPENAARNCDREGPLIGEGPYHEVAGTQIDFNVPASDEGGVWRVVVIYSDQRLVDAGQGRWSPLELKDDGSGNWHGGLRVDGPTRLVYYLQAVDRRGNVSWLLYDGTGQPSSGVDRGIPLPTEVAVMPGSADLSVQLDATPDLISAGSLFLFRAQVKNLGPDSATAIEANLELPPAAAYIFGGGSGWDCEEVAGSLLCSRAELSAGEEGEITVTLLAQEAGTLAGTIQVKAAEQDAVTSNNFDMAQTEVR